MSLASAYRKLGKKSRENLGTAAKGRNLSSLIEQGGDLFGQVFGFADEAFDITENLQTLKLVKNILEFLAMICQNL